MIVTDTARDDQMVGRLLTHKRKCDRVISEAFYVEAVTPRLAASGGIAVDPDPEVFKVPNRNFAYAVIDGFVEGFKSRRNKPAEMIAAHLDRALQKAERDAAPLPAEVTEDMSEADRALLEAERDAKVAAAMADLEPVLTLYRFSEDTDTFRTFYLRALARRLLLGCAPAKDLEKALVEKLKRGARSWYTKDGGVG